MTRSVLPNGELLQPGQSYEWRLSTPFPKKQPPFRVMEQEQRVRISEELRQ